jgi:hypothetical protein
LLRHRPDRPTPPRPWLWRRDQGLSIRSHTRLRRASRRSQPRLYGARRGLSRLLAARTGPAALKAAAGTLNPAACRPRARRRRGRGTDRAAVTVRGALIGSRWYLKS